MREYDRTPPHLRAATTILVAAGVVSAFAACAPSGRYGSADADETATAGALTAAPFPSTVGIMNVNGALFCSGSTLSSRVVITAAHCVVRDGVVHLPYAVFAGVDVRLGGVFLRAQSAVPHPDYDGFLHTADLALLRLVDADPAFAAVPVAATIPALGDPVRFVGYGASDGTPAQRQHVGDATVTSVAADFFRYTPATCVRDSGGPLLVTATGSPQLAGVASMADPSCMSGRAVALAPYASWVAETVATLDPAGCRSDDGACGENCPFGDSDCPCAEDGQCVLCAGVDPDCSESCAPDGNCVERCLSPDPDCHTSQDEADCARDLDCESHACVAGQCRSPCGPDAQTACAPWQICTSVEADRNVCLDLEAPPAGCAVAGGQLPQPSADQDLATAALAVLLGLVLALVRGRGVRLTAVLATLRGRRGVTTNRRGEPS